MPGIKGWINRILRWYHPVEAAATPAAAAQQVGPTAFTDFTGRIAHHDATEYTKFEDATERRHFDSL